MQFIEIRSYDGVETPISIWMNRVLLLDVNAHCNVVHSLSFPPFFLFYSDGQHATRKIDCINEAIWNWCWKPGTLEFHFWPFRCKSRPKKKCRRWNLFRWKGILHYARRWIENPASVRRTCTRRRTHARGNDKTCDLLDAITLVLVLWRLWIIMASDKPLWHLSFLFSSFWTLLQRYWNSLNLVELNPS